MDRGQAHFGRVDTAGDHTGTVKEFFMPLPSLSLVRLVTDCYLEKGVAAGAIGVILEVYGDDAYEVEFSREDGTTIAWFDLPQKEVEPLNEETEDAPLKHPVPAQAS